MEALWFCAIAVMLAVYAVLDGFDLGSGIIHLFLTRNEKERRSVLTAAGPFWDGNEVWLLLAGGALYCAFPAVYSSRGFYSAAITLVWLLILRGLGAELRNRVASPQARHILDTVFGFASLLITLTLGAAVGYVIRSVPPVHDAGAMNGFPALCAICGLACLTLQSAAWMAMKSTGDLRDRCRRLAAGVWWLVVLTYAGVTATTVAAQPHILENLLAHSWICGLVVMALAGLIATRLCVGVNFDLGVFVGASCVIAGLLTSAAAGQYPYLLSATGMVPDSLTVYNAGTSQYGMSLSAIWWIPAFLLAFGFNVSMHRRFRHSSRNGIAASHAVRHQLPAHAPVETTRW
jgi:cytochrome d ubiquinol oxidase subunit II